MACIVLTRNPTGGGVLALTEDDGDNIAQWPDRAAAKAAADDHRLLQAWGGWVIDLDAAEVVPV